MIFFSTFLTTDWQKNLEIINPKSKIDCFSPTSHIHLPDLLLMKNHTLSYARSLYFGSKARHWLIKTVLEIDP
ncbi:hypothetical protein CV014_16905 [Nostoc sp. CMAA1605]|nr:hypothetical protein [Nostoc sp. CMAA1605]